MKKIEIKRDILVPDCDYCVLWKNQKDICTFLQFRKDPKKPKTIWKCDVLDLDLIDSIDSFGIKKLCEEIEHEKDNIIKIDFK